MLKRLREAKDLSELELAKRADVSQAWLSALEAGQKRARARLLDILMERIAQTGEQIAMLARLRRELGGAVGRPPAEAWRGVTRWVRVDP